MAFEANVLSCEKTLVNGLSMIIAWMLGLWKTLGPGLWTNLGVRPMGKPSVGNWPVDKPWWVGCGQVSEGGLRKTLCTQSMDKP